jgi:L-threonylcarbamoyladenylate synthase
VTQPDVAGAAATLRAGGLVAFPTETVYGLGADATNAAAVRRLFAVKGRPVSHPVIVHLGEGASLDAWAAEVSGDARALAAVLWPGPLTVVVRRKAGTIVDEVTGGRGTVGLRVPDHPLALELLAAFGGAIAAPSANRFGCVSPTTARDVRADLGADVDVVLDGGPCTVGVESTIVDCTGAVPAILRLGGVPAERVEQIVGRAVELRNTGEVAAPGTLASHYAPRARVELVAREQVVARANEVAATGQRAAVLAMAPPVRLGGDVALVLAVPADVDEFARVLYRCLREADTFHVDVVLVVPPPDTGVGAAVLDRLNRASAG